MHGNGHQTKGGVGVARESHGLPRLQKPLPCNPRHFREPVSHSAPLDHGPMARRRLLICLSIRVGRLHVENDVIRELPSKFEA